MHDAIVLNCSLDPGNRAHRIEIEKRMRLALFLILTGQNIPFLHGGQERGRSKPNLAGDARESMGPVVRNSYDATDDINHFPWTVPEEYRDLEDFTRRLIAIRREHGIFRIDDHERIARASRLLVNDDDDPFLLAYELVERVASRDISFRDDDLEGDRAWVIVAHAGREPRSLELPGGYPPLRNILGDTGVRYRRGARDYIDCEPLSLGLFVST